MIKLMPLLPNKEWLERIACWRNDSLISLRSGTLTNPSQQDEWIASLKFGKDIYFYIVQDGNPIGYCGLDKVDLFNRNAEISCLIGTEYQSRGYGKEAVQNLLRYGFEQLGLNRIYAEVYLTTSRWTFWEKCGFRREALLEDRKLWQGEWFDSIYGSIDALQFREVERGLCIK